MNSLPDKQHRLQKLLLELAPLAIAFSGGVDSSLLLKVACDTLGEQCLAVTVDAPYHFRQELADAARFAGQIGARHLIIPFDPHSVPGLLENQANRCYLCKKAILSLCLTTLASCSCPLDSAPWTLADGSTLDDQSVHRPGRQALQELGVHSPLAEAGFNKQDIRDLSRKLGLATWDKPAQSCLLTRFPYNRQITPEELRRVERCETELQQLGFNVVRVRSLGTVARIESEDLQQTQSLLSEIDEICKRAGFSEVQIDPAGYRSGSMDTSDSI